MRSSSLAPLALALALPRAAEAGACCAGSTTTVPTRLGECEKAGLGFGLTTEAGTGRWDSTGVARESSLGEEAYIATVSGAWRWNRSWQVIGSVPMRLNHKTTSTGDATWGGGQGDVGALVLWDPVEERPRGGEALALPIPVMSLGVRAPTGRGWEASDDPLFTDVTGTGRGAVLANLTFERTLDRMPWSVGVDQEVSPGADRTDGVTRGAASLGRTIGTRWTLNASAVHQRTWTLGTEASSSRTSAGLRLVHGRVQAWRAWLGAEADLPVSGFGHSSERAVRASTGFVTLF